MHFFGLVMYSGNGINFSFKLSWFKILCANDWSKKFFNPKYQFQDWTKGSIKTKKIVKIWAKGFVSNKKLKNINFNTK